MKIVIDIDNETYGRIQALVNADYFEHDICGYSMKRIANGISYEERPIEDLSEYSDKLWQKAYERGKAERPQGDIIDIIKSITDDISIKKDVNGYRPIKNTSKDSCYKALFEIIELLRNSGNIGGEEDV